MKSLSIPASRQTSGNMLVLSGVGVSFVVLLMVLLSSFGSLVFVHNRLQATADEIALEGASKLNDMDRLGQINNMIARCRQLVYAQQNLHDDAESENEPDEVKHLATDLLEESKQSATTLEQERSQVLLPLCQAEARTAMLGKFEAVKQSYRMILPWLQISALTEPTSSDISFGEINGVESCVSEMTAQSDLAANDRSQSLVKVTSGLNLYKHDQEHRLSGPPGYLSFKLSSLQAPVRGVISPARVALAREFGPVPKDFLPSAVQIKLKVDVATGLGTQARAQVVVMGTAATTGAGVQQ